MIVEILIDTRCHAVAVNTLEEPRYSRSDDLRIRRERFIASGKNIACTVARFSVYFTAIPFLARFGRCIRPRVTSNTYYCDSVTSSPETDPCPSPSNRARTYECTYDRRGNNAPGE